MPWILPKPVNSSLTNHWKLLGSWAKLLRKKNIVNCGSSARTMVEIIGGDPPKLLASNPSSLFGFLDSWMSKAYLRQIIQANSRLSHYIPLHIWINISFYPNIMVGSTKSPFHQNPYHGLDDYLNKSKPISSWSNLARFWWWILPSLMVKAAKIARASFKSNAINSMFHQSRWLLNGVSPVKHRVLL